MKRLWAIAFFGILAISAAAQDGASAIEGQVTDEAGKPVKGAVVTLVGQQTKVTLTTVTDERGRYRFRRLEPGIYVLEAARTGANSHGRSGSVELTLASGSLGRLDLRLSWEPAIRERVDVRISAGTAQPISEVSKTVDFIGSGEITARNEISLADTLRTIPGFRIQQLGGFGKTANIKTRGLRNQDTAVLIDGMRLRDPSSINGDASAFISDITVAGVNRIEVLRGSGSSVYGTNAIGGVVDIQTAVPVSGLHGDVRGQYGGLGLKQVQGTASGALGRFGFSTGFSRTVFSEGVDGNDDALNNGLNTRFDFRPFSNFTFSGTVFLTDSFVRLNAGPDTLGDVSGGGIFDARPGVNFAPDANDPDSTQDSNLLSGQFRFTGVINSRLTVKAAYQALKTRRENRNGSLGPGFQPFGGTEVSIFAGRIDTFSASVNWTPDSSNLLTAGYEFESEHYGNEGFGPANGSDFFARSKQRSNTLFVSHLSGFFGRRLQIAGGARIQLFSLGSTRFSVQNAPYEGLRLQNLPNAYTFDGSMSYRFRKTGTRVRAHAGNGFRVPSLFERLGTFYSSFSQQFVALGDPDLKPERSIAFDAGIEQRIAGDALELSATYFYTRLTDTIGFGFPASDIGSTSRPFGGYRNEKGGIARGFELSLRAKPFAATELFASYTYTNSDRRRPQVAGSGVITSLGIPARQFTMVATQNIGKRLSLNFDLLVSDSYLAPIFSNQIFSTVIYRFEGSRRGDLTARYRFPVIRESFGLTVFATAQNVFDNRYFENGFKTEGRTARIGLGLDF